MNPASVARNSLPGFCGPQYAKFIARRARLKNRHMRKTAFASFCLTFATFLLLSVAARAENPHWIWHDNHGAAIQADDVRYFRKTFKYNGKLTKAILSIAADDEATVYINGKEVAHP